MRVVVADVGPLIGLAMDWQAAGAQVLVIVDDR
jgi:hypothetical protein